MEHTILFVDDEKNILNCLYRLFRKDDLKVMMAESGKEGLELLKKSSATIVVSDHRMPEMDGVEFLSRVKELYPDTVRFMLTGYADVKAVMSAINKVEVYRYITKPWADDEFKRTIKEALEVYDLKAENKRLLEVTKKQNSELLALNHGLEAKVAERTKKIKDNFFAFVRIVANLMELHDPYIGGQCKRVAEMARKLGKKMLLDEGDLELIESAALLHTIGLIGVPKEIINKDEQSLTESERALLRHNPTLSQDLLSSIDTLRQVGIIIRGYCERYDGKGYPDGLKRDEIHLGAMIISICKFYDSLRFGAKTMSRAGIFELIRGERGAKFDPEVTDNFLGFLSEWRDEPNPVSSGQNAKHSEDESILNIPFSELRSGMVLAENLMTYSGRLLVTKGTSMTTALIDKITNFNKVEPVSSDIRIIRPEGLLAARV